MHSAHDISSIPMHTWRVILLLSTGIGTIVGTSQFLKEQNPNIQIIGVQPEDGAQIPGIRKWPEEYLPEIFTMKNIDTIVNVSQNNAEKMARQLAQKEGIFSGDKISPFL